MRLPLLRLAALAAAATSLLLAAPVSHGAALRPVTGTLTSAAPFTVVAIAPNGVTTTARTTRGRFAIVPPATSFTLHLRLRGDYRGPVVAKRLSATKVVMALRPGAALGAVRVYAKHAAVVRALPATAIDAQKVAAASAGVPLGAAGLGRVNMRRIKFKAARIVPTETGQGGDSDLDGLPNVFDVDDDGDLVLDNVDAHAGLSKGPHTRGADEFWMFSNFKLPLEQTVNLHAGGLARATIDDRMRRWVTMAIQRVDGDAVELDCGGLTYCSKGGTGRADWNFIPGDGSEIGRAFPDEYDPDHDGMGSIEKGGTGDFQLFAGASSAQVNAGDTFVQHVQRDGATVRYAGMLPYIFNTVPAIQRWTSAAGDDVTMSYPVADGAAGTARSPFTVGANDAGDVVITFTYWRPQRAALAGEPSTGGWVDIGRMRYETWIFVTARPDPGTAPGSEGGGPCPDEAYSEGDAQLTLLTNRRGVLDAAADAPADAANTLTYTVNLSACARANGASLDTGDHALVGFEARTLFGDNAAQNLSFVRR